MYMQGIVLFNSVHLFLWKKRTATEITALPPFC